MRFFRYVTLLRRWWKRYGHDSSMEFLITFCLITAVGFSLLKVIDLTVGPQCKQELTKAIHNNNNVSEIPLVFVTGTSMTAVGFVSKILGYHPQLSHWKRASILVKLHNLQYTAYTNKVEAERLRQAGVSVKLYDSAIMQIWRHLLSKYNPGSPRPMFAELNSLQSSSVTNRLFPNAKFLFVARDGRAAVYDNHGGNREKRFNSTFYKKKLEKWNTDAEMMYKSCNALGKERCIIVSYEDVLMDTNEELLKLYNHFDLNTTVLSNLMTRNEPVQESIYAKEPHSIPELVVRMKNTGTLWKWVNFIPPELKDDMDMLAPMLQVLGYDPFYYPKPAFISNYDNISRALYN